MNRTIEALPCDSSSEEWKIEALNTLLPQWQCRKCEYDGCKAYAKAIVHGAAINRCPPGGEKVLQSLDNFAVKHLQREPAILANQQSINSSLAPAVSQTAVIRTDQCIGCMRCIPACPLSAIVGGKRSLHVVLTEACSGCELCVPVCPMNCIDFLPTTPWQADDPRQRDYQEAMNRQQRVLIRRNHPLSALAVADAPSHPHSNPPSPIRSKTEWLQSQAQNAIRQAQDTLKSRHSIH
jgi:electron transport complex protein RnfB